MAGNQQHAELPMLMNKTYIIDFRKTSVFQLRFFGHFSLLWVSCADVSSVSKSGMTSRILLIINSDKFYFNKMLKLSW